ncbi:MAG: diaminohydroxyphosphoribosylaminopyrimidine deaminase [Actinomycetota bacterium]|nr:diaminohydroxyphosphoribosylaminopyrimidine deaminase [Actinomycetota bacterium]
MQDRDEVFMRRALEVAARPAFTSPNPRVGAVVVKDGTILSEGAHQGAGTPHAEAVALDGIDARGATLYVTLEPCNHVGRMPPCAPAIVASGITRVVAAIEDPDHRVSGRGFAHLREHGIELVTGVLSDEARAQNVAFFHACRTGRPLITLKLALTLDGRLGAADGSARWITGESARAHVHARRQEAGAVLVGAGTVLADDPELTVRAIEAARQPLRVIVDARGRVSEGAAIFDPDVAPVLVATTALAAGERQVAWKEAGAEVVVLDAVAGGVDLSAVIAELGRRSITEVYCEGGARLATSLLRDDLVDRLELYYGPVLVGDGPHISSIGVTSMGDARRWRTCEVRRFDDDVMIVLERA